MSDATAERGAGAGRASDWLLAGGLAVALSPGVYDLLHHWAVEPWSRYSAVFVVAVVWLARRTPPARSHPLPGLLLLAVGLAVQLLAVAGVMPALGRVALVPGFAGLALWRGWAPPAVLVLAVFAVPVPYQLTDWTGGDVLAPELYRGAAQLLRGVGVTVAAGERRVVSGDVDFQIDAPHAGLPTAVLALGLFTLACLRLRPAAPVAAAWGAAILAGAAGLHLLAVVGATLAVAWGSEPVARFCVETLSWALPTGAVLLALRATSARTR